MSIIQGNTKVSAGGYEIDQSIRFPSPTTGYLNRTPSSASDRRTWTWSGWIKRSKLATLAGSADAVIFGADASSTNYLHLRIDGASTNADQLYLVASSSTMSIRYAPLLRDVSAWYHIVIRMDTTDGTAADRAKVYLNGAQITDIVSSTYPSLNREFAVNNTVEHDLGRLSYAGSETFEGYMSEINFVDGTALDATSFGEYNDDGVWVPIAYTNAAGYGTNGFYITGENSVDLGADYSGNGNDWTSTGLTSDDQMLDTPTNNFPTFSPINLDGVTLANGNLKCNSAGYWSGAAATMSLPTTGKWYIETLVGNRYGSYMAQGFVPNDGSLITNAAAALSYGSQDSTNTPNYGLGISRGNTFGFYAASGTTIATVTEPDGSTLYSTNEIYMCHAIDLDNERYFVGTAFVGDGSVTWFGHAGIGADPEIPSEGLDISAYLATYGSYGLTFFHAPNASSGNPYATVDFGQSGYTFTKPTSYSELNTANLPTPSIKDGSAYFQPTLYTGNSSTLEVNQSGNSTFQPDWLWVKSRSLGAGGNHVLYDAVRGNTKELYTSLTNAESTTSALTSFDTDGFTLQGTGVGTADNRFNQSGETYVAWQWKANGAGSSNTDGSINTTATSVNTTAGFSISTYTGNATVGATVSHGLGIAPKVVIVKSRSNAESWIFGHDSVGWNKAMYMNSTVAPYTLDIYWNNTAPTSSVVELHDHPVTNGSGATYVMYAFAEIPGYSSFGNYIGNGSATDGPFVYTGFKPKWIMYKSTTAGTRWGLLDTDRSASGGGNSVGDQLFAELTAVEADADHEIDFLSNGFKVRDASGSVNGNGYTITYMAFAEHPFGGDGVAPATAR